MKKLITLLLVLTGMVSTASATEYTVYFKPSSNWTQASAKFALYMWNDNTSTHNTVDFAAHATITGVYTATYDDTYSSGCSILRVDPNASGSAGTGDGYGWENQGKGWWAQTADLPAPESDVFFDMSAASDWNTTTRYYYLAANSTDINDGNGTWGGDNMKHTMIPASDYATSNLVQVSYSNRLLTAGKSYQYKIVNQPTSGAAGWYPGSNKEFTVDKDGYYTITYTYNTSTNEVANPTVTLTQEVEYRYGVQRTIDGGSNWTLVGAQNMAVSGNDAIITVPLSLNAEENNIQYKISREVYVNGVYQSSTWSWTDSGVSGGCYVFTPLHTGDHTVTFHYNTATATPDVWAHYKTSNYYYIGGSSDWDNSKTNQLTGDGAGNYSITVNGKGGHTFAIAPDYAYDGDNVNTWTEIIHPYVSSGNVTVDFANNSGQVQIANTSQNWEVASDYADYITLTFNNTTNTWSVEPYFEKNIYKAADGYATFSSDKAVAIPDGVTAKFTKSVTSGTINWTTIANGIPADQGALLYSAAAAASANEYETYYFAPATTTDDLTGNLMKHIASKTQLAQSTADNTTNFILSKVADNLGFYKVNKSGSWCNAGTAYLQVANGDFSPARAFFLFDDDSNTTAIEAVKKEQKMNGEYYNLAGQRVAQPTKGLYIVNGKKVIVK